MSRSAHRFDFEMPRAGSCSSPVCFLPTQPCTQKRESATVPPVALHGPEWRRFARALNGKTSDNGLGYIVDEAMAGHFAMTCAIPPTGQHYIVLECEDQERNGRRPCCCSIGIVPNSSVSLPTGHIMAANEIPFMISQMGIGSGIGGAAISLTSGAEQMPIGILVDMDKRTVFFVDHSRPLVAPIAMVGIPSSCRIAVQGPKHKVKYSIRRSTPLFTPPVPTEAMLFKKPSIV